MPSGAKKRKAAKKKKDIIHHSNGGNNSFSSLSSVQSHVEDDLKPQDDQESDVGEVSSPTSQSYHSSQNVLIEEEDNEMIQGDSIVVERIVVQVERGSKFEDESNKKNGNIDNDERKKKSSDGGSIGSFSITSSSNSDNESHGSKDSTVVQDTASIVDSRKGVDSLSNGATFSSIKEDGISTAKNIPTEKIREGVDNAASLLNPKDSVVQVKDVSLTLSEHVTRADADGGAEISEDCGFTQPLLAPVPHPEQKASWKSCCGLFDLFTGSS